MMMRVTKVNMLMLLLMLTFWMQPLKAWTGVNKVEKRERSGTPPIQRC